MLPVSHGLSKALLHTGTLSCSRGSGLHPHRLELTTFLDTVTEEERDCTGFSLSQPQSAHVSSARILLCKTSQTVPPNSKRRLDTVGKSVKYLLSIMMCSHWNVISHLTSCWPSNFSRAGAVSALLCILSTKPYGRLLVVFVVVEWVSFFFQICLFYLVLVLLGLGCCTSFSVIALGGLLVGALIVEQGVWGCSSCGYWALEHNLSSCGAGLSCSADLSRLGIKPVSPVLAGGSFSTEPPGKPQVSFFNLTSTQITSFKNLPLTTSYHLPATWLQCNCDFLCVPQPKHSSHCIIFFWKFLLSNLKLKK